jgi:hypothetical protein
MWASITAISGIRFARPDRLRQAAAKKIESDGSQWPPLSEGNRQQFGILEAVSRREKLVKENTHAVASGHAIGDALINLLCCSVLECLSYYDEPPPHSFQIQMQATNV